MHMWIFLALLSHNIYSICLYTKSLTQVFEKENLIFILSHLLLAFRTLNHFYLFIILSLSWSLLCIFNYFIVIIMRFYHRVEIIDYCLLSILSPVRSCICFFMKVVLKEKMNRIYYIGSIAVHLFEFIN